MPAYGSQTLPNALYQGDEGVAFNAEAVAAGNNSIQFAIAPDPFGVAPQLSLSIAFSSAPTAVITVQAANDDATGNYVNTATASTNKQTDRIDFTTNAPFIRLTVTSLTAGGNLTAKIYRAA